MGCVCVCVCVCVRVCSHRLEGMSSFLMLLAFAALAATASGQCSPAGQNCWLSQCCEDPKALCHAKKEGYALCLRNCTKGIHIGEPKNDSYWECNVLAKCAWGAASGENCMIKGCCQEPNKTCFTREDGYGQCQNLCPKDWDCKTVTQAHTNLEFPCNKKFEQCGGDGFNKNPCCEKGLLCTGDKPKYYMQCVDKPELAEKAKKSDDDDDSADLGLSALPSSLLEEHEEEEEAEAEGPFTKLQILYALGGTLLVVSGVAAFAARQQVCQRQATHQTLSAEEGFEEEAMFT